MSCRSVQCEATRWAHLLAEVGVWYARSKVIGKVFVVEVGVFSASRDLGARMGVWYC